MADFFTSDWHLGNPAIIGYTSRPFKSEESMRNSLIRTCNQRAKACDTVYHIGDFCSYGDDKGVPGLKKPVEFYEDPINAKVIHVLGNHDPNNGVKSGVWLAIVNFGGLNVALSHKPIYDSCFLPMNIDLVLCGHVHQAWSEKIESGLPHINVGVDVRKYTPMSKNDVLKVLNTSKVFK